MKEMKPGKVRRVLCITAAAGIGFLMAAALLCMRNLYIKRENLLAAYEKQSVSGVVCFGDSLTAEPEERE